MMKGRLEVSEEISFSMPLAFPENASSVASCKDDEVVTRLVKD